MNRLAILVAVALLAAATAEPSSAHYKGQKRWYFGGLTHNGDGRRIDPVNILFYPDAVTRTDLEVHLQDHWRPRWFTHDDLGFLGAREALCRGNQKVSFRTETGGERDFQTSFHGAGSRFRCLNRYHLRAWKDDDHETVTGVNHTNAQSWIVGGIHYERIKNKEGHKPAVDWDVVEWRTMIQMSPHSHNYRWKVLPGSKGWFQGFWSDGRITRISAVQPQF